MHLIVNNRKAFKIKSTFGLMISSLLPGSTNMACYNNPKKDDIKPYQYPQLQRTKAIALFYEQPLLSLFIRSAMHKSTFVYTNLQKNNDINKWKK